MRPCLTPGCPVGIPPQQGPAQPRKYCTTCRPPRNRRNPRVIDLPPPAAVLDTAAVPAELPELPVLAAYRQQLTEAGRLDTPEGAHVLHLADLFTHGAHTAAGAAALSKELRAAMGSALRGAPARADALDEIAARRRLKAGSA